MEPFREEEDDANELNPAPHLGAGHANTEIPKLGQTAPSEALWEDESKISRSTNHTSTATGRVAAARPTAWPCVDEPATRMKEERAQLGAGHANGKTLQGLNEIIAQAFANIEADRKRRAAEAAARARFMADINSEVLHGSTALLADLDSMYPEPGGARFAQGTPDIKSALAAVRRKAAYIDTVTAARSARRRKYAIMNGAHAGFGVLYDEDLEDAPKLSPKKRSLGG